MKLTKLLSAVLMVGALTVTGMTGLSVVHAADKPQMMVSDAWARERPAVIKVGGVFATLHNMGGEADTLVAASSPAAEKVEIHNVSMTDGVMKMFEVEGVEIPAGETVEFKPGSYHIMLMGLKQPLTKGSTFPLTLEFAKAGKINVTVEVKEAGAMEMKEHKHH
ncbi:MAG: hypothetical protein CMN55_05275 [Sneathiella sp.]|uniref:copper chaperone PCu(A)C n=1 Tax=Sneathiella sp. TaxID=1964365 RepID=UPI000C4294DE|nr:copper chaperone PCu(A)C [Sneathiella sp.]MAL78511.1 hypothetical protein [Sneathiella sp.]